MSADQSPTRFTATAAFLAGALALASMASYLFWPDVLMTYGIDFFLGVVRNEPLFRFTYLTFALSALLSLALVLAMSELLQGRHRDLVRWTSLVGAIGYAVVALHFASFQGETVRIARAYVNQAGGYEGYGIHLGPSESGEMLVAPFPPESAGEAGFERGGVLVALNGEAITPGSTLEEVINRSAWDGEEVIASVRGGDGATREVALDVAQRSFWNLEAQQAIEAMAVPALDRNFLFGFGLVGLWLVVANWLARRQDGFPGPLPYIGIGAGITLWLFAAGNQFGVEALSLAGLYGGLVLVPVWLLWSGIALPRIRWGR